MANLHRRSARYRSREGATVVEMAMCLPILFILLFGCYEFSRANMMRHATSAAAYEGARRGIVPGATVEDVEESVRFVLSTLGVRQFNVEVTPSPIGLDNRLIQVRVSLNMRDNTSLGLMFSENARFLGECELSREGF